MLRPRVTSILKKILKTVLIDTARGYVASRSAAS